MTVIIACVAVLVIVFALFGCNLALNSVYYTPQSEKVNTPVKIAFLSDVHNSLYGKNMSGLIGAVDDFSPDAVVLGGDLFDENWGEKNSIDLVRGLVEKYPCYYAIGNHEMWVGNVDRIKENMRSMGVTVLDGKYSDLTVGESKVRFIGIDGSSYTQQAEAAIDAVSDEYCNILINHYPMQFAEFQGKGFDFILSGHAHGGQVRIPFVLNGLYAPGEGFFPKYAGGEYIENGTELIVSRGLYRQLSCILIPRVFNRPEAVFITISGKGSGQ